jgi:PLP dependent protein
MSPAEKLAAIQSRVQRACENSGRAPSTVSLLAVSKTFPLQNILEFSACGQLAFGENYLQEAVEKITRLADHPDAQAIEWHFIGPIQSNKTKPIAEHFDWVHSVDRLKIAQRLSSQRPPELPPLNVLVQMNTSGESSKSGVNASEALQLCREVAKLPSLRLRGLMTIPSNTDNADALKAEFLACKATLDELKQEGLELDTLSMGMSADLELAVECGSTCVRVGSALFGSRTTNQPGNAS